MAIVCVCVCMGVYTVSVCDKLQGGFIVLRTFLMQMLGSHEYLFGVFVLFYSHGNVCAGLEIRFS